MQLTGRKCGAIMLWTMVKVLMFFRRILLFPFGNNVDFASLYLEQGHDDEDKLLDGWYACVQFTLVLWNSADPSIYLLHSKQSNRKALRSNG